MPSAIVELCTQNGERVDQHIADYRTETVHGKEQAATPFEKLASERKHLQEQQAVSR